MTNVRRLSRGQTVLIVNSHLVEGESGDVIVACGGSYIAVINGEHDSIYASDEYHGIANAALKNFLSYRTVLQLVRMRRSLLAKFPETRDRLMSCKDGNLFADELINAWDADALTKTTGVSPLREFCCNEELHKCHSLGADARGGTSGRAPSWFHFDQEF